MNEDYELWMLSNNAQVVLFPVFNKDKNKESTSF